MSELQQRLYVGMPARHPTGAVGAGYGYPKMGPFWGGQAEYLRVPYADFNLLELPPGTDYESEFTFLDGTRGEEEHLVATSPSKTAQMRAIP